MFTFFNMLDPLKEIELNKSIYVYNEKILVFWYTNTIAYSS